LENERLAKKKKKKDARRYHRYRAHIIDEMNHQKMEPHLARDGNGILASNWKMIHLATATATIENPKLYPTTAIDVTNHP
jgi:hypothetical protein